MWGVVLALSQMTECSISSLILHFSYYSLQDTRSELQKRMCWVWLGSQRPELGRRAPGSGSLGGQGSMTVRGLCYGATKQLAEEPKGLKMASSWGPRPLEAHRPFSLPQNLASVIPAYTSSNLNYNQLSRLSLRLWTDSESQLWVKKWKLWITGQLVSLPGFLAFILVLSEKHWAKQWAENREPVLLPNFIQSICFQMRNCPHTMPEGGEG